MLKIKKLKPTGRIPASLNKQIDKYFAHKIFEKYGINRFRKQFGSLVFKMGTRDYEKTSPIKMESISGVVNNHSWYLNEYKPIINIQVGREPVYLKTIKEKPVPIYIYSEKLMNKPAFPGAQTGGERLPDRKVYIKNTGRAQSVKTSEHTREASHYRTVNIYTGRPAANENTLPDYKILPGSSILQYNTTTLQRNSYLHTGIRNFNSGTKAYYTNITAQLKPFQNEKAALFTHREPPVQRYGTENGKDTPDEYKSTVEPLLFKQWEMPRKNVEPYYQNHQNQQNHQIFNYTKFNNITEFSNHYRINKNTLLQTEETYSRVIRTGYERLSHTDIRKDTVLKELYYSAVPLTRVWGKQDPEAAHRQAHMPTQKNTPGFLPESKNSGLILYKPKMEKPAAAENQLAGDILPGRNEVYTKALTASAYGKRTNIDSPEEINQLAEKVYGLIEKRLGIQKDRRGIR